MNRRGILSVSAMTLLGVVLLSGNAIAQQKTLKEQLVGTWTAVSVENTAPNGSKRHVYGANPKGQYIFDASGRFSLMLVNPDIPKFKIANRLEGTPEENKAVVHGTTAYFGTWSVDEPNKAIVLKMDGHIFPNFRGATQKRTVTRISADEWESSNAESGYGGTTVSVWKRAK
jgi:hypothetical protein